MNATQALLSSLTLSPMLQARLSQPLQIGSVAVHSRVLQSPLSGVTDRVFRRLVRRHAPASMMYSEMVSAAELCQLRSLPRIMDIDPDERPIGIQLFDRRPEFLAEAARRAVDQGADVVDINMGCPVNKITKNGGGSALLQEPETAVKIVAAVSRAVAVPVTVKTRLGWSDDAINAVKFAQQMADAGAQLLTLHGRTRAQGYNGAARWDWIAKVKQALTIPVIANGDIDSVAAAVRCLELTGADGVMCSRGTLGNPFLVGEIDHFLKTGQRRPGPTPVERLLCAREHLTLLWEYKGDSGIRQSRKHMAWYAKGFVGAADWRDRLCRIESVEQGHDLLDQAIAALEAIEAAAPAAVAL
ncbi:tRNA dihydrouridine synthase DusB [Romeria aff. gracilis LEGE 07310]|uniref:tRNA-dihydrouridine synthase n=1 Tax=Vasconcelosia minhoensis LEGE 07310 TaxID=915328 RepID=A0A8J7DMY5_9CYAN|nr:tRNA dihydrouridine synthase DusB [Romeria gracilis]MBE9077450.1 tRNA dihydrouridine synthase DusB [Romeria aff. gracilis LEGE 07310]